MNARQLRGIVLARRKLILPTKNGWLVPSQTGKGFYEVSEEDFSCTCADYQAHKVTCKHAYAARYHLTDQLKAKVDLPPVKKPAYPQDWRNYTKAQNEEVQRFNQLMAELIKEIEEPAQTMGRPRLSLRETIHCAVQKVYSQLSSRRAHSLYRNAQERQQIGRAPNYNAINKLLNQPELTPLLHKLLEISASPLRTVETDFAVDSTGFRTTRFNEWAEDRFGLTRDKKWLKAHLCCGVKTNVVTAVKITDEHGADSPQLPYLVERTAQGFQIREVSADKGYSSRDNYDAIASFGGQGYIPFKEGSTGGSRGSDLWRKMFHFFLYRHREFLAHYHKRSNVESTVNMIKTKFGDSLKSKNYVAQVNELLCKIIAHNIVVVIHECRELGVTPEFK